MSGVLMRKPGWDTERHRHTREGDMWWWRQRLEGGSCKPWGPRLLAVTKANMKGCSPRAFRETMALLTHRFWTSDLHNCETMCLFFLSHPTIGTFLWQPQKTNTLLLLPIVLAQSSRVIILEYKSSHVIPLLKHTRMGSHLTENEVNVFAMSHKVLRDLPLWPRLLLLFYLLSLACASFETYKASSVLTVPST